MRVTVTEAERLLVETMLQFANRRARSTWAVEDSFKKLPFLGYFDKSGREVFYSVNRDRDPKVEKQGIANYENDRAKLRSQLERIASGNQTSKIEVAREVERVLGRTVPFSLKINESTGRLSLMYGLGGVEARCSWAVALILDSEKGLTNRLGLCDAPHCSRFNLAFTGRPRRYCNEKHRLAADALRGNERVKQWRAWVKKHGGKKKREPVSSAE